MSDFPGLPAFILSLADALLSTLPNHLWQSTLFALGIAVLTLLLRQNSARLRHALWVIASLKFLLPFALLTAMGTQISWQPQISEQAQVVPRVLAAATDVVAPVEHVDFFPRIPVKGATEFSLRKWTLNEGMPLLAGIWLAGALFIVFRWLRRWRAIRRLVRDSRMTADIDFAAPVHVTPEAIEPGIVGIFRPMLLLPEGMQQRLTDEQMRSVLAHELCHLRRHDNLTAALHMLVETLFWFHPLVWWIGARLIDERERACDEQVLREGHAPESYSEAILRVCEHYVASRLPCVSGVSGSDLRQRIESILRHPVIVRLNRSKKLVLAALACAAVAAPIAAGVVQWRAAQARSLYRTALLDYWSVITPPDEACSAPDPALARRQSVLASKVRELEAGDGDKVLLYAVASNSASEVRRLLIEGADHGGDGFLLENSLMHIAARFGDAAVLQVLTDFGFDMNSLASPMGADRDSLLAETPLMVAIAFGRKDNAEWLLDHGANAGTTGKSGKSALVPAMVLCKDQALTTRLIRAGAQPDDKARRIAANLKFDLGGELPAAMPATAPPAAQIQDRHVPTREELCHAEDAASRRGVLVSWVTGSYSVHDGDGKKTFGSFRALALLDGNTLTANDGSTIAKGQKYWPAIAPDSGPVELVSASMDVNRQGKDHCLYSAAVSDPDLPRWTLLTSQPLPGVFRPPTEAQKLMFRQLHPECRVQGDYPEGQEPPCVRAEILAVSDVNRNGETEYWATTPYLWDTGLTVWEDRGELLPVALLRLCPGCAD